MQRGARPRAPAIGPAELALVLEQLHELVLIINEGGELLFANRAALRRAGRALDGSLDGVPVDEMFGGALAEHLRTVAVPIALQEGESNSEVELVTSGGDITRASLVVTAHRPDGPGLTFLSAVLREGVPPSDADTAARARRELAHLSHELRAPLSGVIGLSAVMLEGQLDREQRDCAETIRESAQNALKILNDVLDLSKIEAHKLVIHIIDFDLRSLLRHLRRLLSVAAAAVEVKLGWQVSPEVPGMVRGDPGRLRQVLTNLLDNAIKFAPGGNVELAVAVEQEDESSALLRFSVSDTGVGIPPESVPSLFRPFVQLDNATTITTNAAGAGLGLAISRELVELMGGQLRVQSIPGAGSTFWFSVGLAKGRTATPRCDPHAHLAGKRVLIVDDTEPFCRLIARTLCGWGIRAEAAFGGVSALAKLTAAAREGDPFDLALIDLIMPEVSGADVASRIVQDRLLHDTVLVCTTAAGQRGDTLLAERSGFAAYLSKPFSLAELRACLCSLLSPEARIDRPSTIITRYSIAESRAASFRVLLADDDRVHRGLLLRTLERVGCRAQAVGDGRSAIEAASRDRYQLVFLDLQMPGMTGLEVARVLRDPSSAALDHDVPLVALSAMVDDEVKERCSGVGFDGVLLKPVEPSLLGQTVERFIFRSETDLPVFDREGALARTGGDRTLLAQVIDMFLQDAATLSQALDRAVAAADQIEVQRIAHLLQSAAASMGAEVLRGTLRQLEAAARARDCAGMADRLEIVQRELRIVGSTLERELEHAGPDGPASSR